MRDNLLNDKDGSLENLSRPIAGSQTKEFNDKLYKIQPLIQICLFGKE